MGVVCYDPAVRKQEKLGTVGQHSSDAWLTKADKRRLAIIQCAIHAIAAEDLSAVTLDRVAKGCGLRRSHVAYYFEDVPALLYAAIHYVISVAQEANVRALAEANTPQERLTVLVRSNLEWYFLNREYAATSALLHYFATCNKDYRKLHTELAQIGEDRFTQVLFSGSPGRPKDREKAAALAHRIRAFLIGSVFTFTGTTPRLSMEKEVARLQTEVRKIADELWK